MSEVLEDDDLKEINLNVSYEIKNGTITIYANLDGLENESEEKGARKFLSLGAGFKYNIVKLDVSYLFSASKVRNPLENTLRFSLSFAFGDQYDEY